MAVGVVIVISPFDFILTVALLVCTALLSFFHIVTPVFTTVYFGGYEVVAITVSVFKDL